MFFRFKEFTIYQDRCAMKVTTDACLFGAMVAAAPHKNELNVLDIGTGTGLLSLMFAQKNPGAILDAIEIDKDAAEQANENAMASPWKDRLNIIHADARGFAFSKKYDLIISNPPFYEKEIISTDKRKNLAHHQEGLLLEELAGLVKANLQPGGSFYFLLPDKRNAEIKKLLLQKQLEVPRVVFIRPSVNQPYFRMVLEGALPGKSPEITIDELAIWDEQKNYTEEFSDLLKDYYLYL